MKRFLLLPLFLLAAPVAYAQKARDFVQFDAGEFDLVPSKEQVMVYGSLPDTASKPSLRLARTKQVVVVGEYSPRWAVMRREGISYFIRQADLADLGPGQTVKQAAAILNAPLPVDADTHLIDFAKVVQVSSANKDELYARGKVWFANTFKSAQHVIQADDKDAGILIGKGWQLAYLPSNIGSSTAIKLWYTVKFAFKDGRYRYNITDFSFEYIDYLTPPHQSITVPFSAEGATNGTRRDGTPTPQAKAYTRALSQAMRGTREKLELSMNKPAIGADF